MAIAQCLFWSSSVGVGGDAAGSLGMGLIRSKVSLVVIVTLV